MRVLWIVLTAVWALRLIREVSVIHRVEQRKAVWTLAYSIVVFAIVLAATFFSFSSPAGVVPVWVLLALAFALWLGPELVARALGVPSPLRELWTHRNDPVSFKSDADARGDRPSH
ncbi:MAG: hypothetical protein AAGU11_23675 [Syntrophobacteraceae bacterium]